jgi:hypothetical protein
MEDSFDTVDTETPEQRLDKRFGWHAGEGTFSQCFYCVHKHPHPPMKWNEVQGARSTCNAFPEGIPDDIRYNHFDHRRRFPGDGGVVFTPIPGEPPAPEPKPM